MVSVPFGAFHFFNKPMEIETKETTKFPSPSGLFISLTLPLKPIDLFTLTMGFSGQKFLNKTELLIN